MNNVILEYTLEGFYFAIAGTPKVVSVIVTKQIGDELYHQSCIVTRECIAQAACDAMAVAITKAVDSIRERIRHDRHKHSTHTNGTQEPV